MRPQVTGGPGVAVPDPGRPPALSTLTPGQLERTRRELAAALALARPGSPAHGPIRAHLAAHLRRTGRQNQPAAPASTAATLAAMLARHGLTRIYVAACSVIAVISISAALTAWTNGPITWITRDGQRETWPAADTQAAAARLAALARHDMP